jgi:flagellar protein FliT
MPEAMMTTEEILNAYARMAELTQQMLAAARAGDWDQLVLLEQHAAAQTRTLQQGEPAAPLQGAARERKVELIRTMLIADRQIRDLTMPWMAQLSALINSTGTERRLASAYGGV